MAIALSHPISGGQRTDWVALAHELGPRFAERAAAHDVSDTFVTTNYAELRAHRVFSAGVPAELGGGGASHSELCAMLRTFGHYCSSTALALSMHTHQVAVPVGAGVTRAPRSSRCSAGSPPRSSSSFRPGDRISSPAAEPPGRSTGATA